MQACNRESGFTLLEMVVVMVIIATLATLAALSVGSLGRGAALQDAAERIVLAVDLGAEEAALSGYPVGLDISDVGFEYLIYRDGQWQLLNHGRLFDPYDFGAGLSVSLERVNEAPKAKERDSLASVHPTVVLLPDGERWLRTIALFDSNDANNSVTLSPVAGNYHIETVSP